MNNNNEQPDTGFTIRDRRVVHKEKVKEAPQPKPKTAREQSPPPPESEKQATEKQSPEAEKPQGTPPEITFAGLIFSLSHTALIQLGEALDPSTNKKEKNTAAAKQTIDLISLLEEKTKGNLSKDEELLVKNVLYDLRMRFVQNSP